MVQPFDNRRLEPTGTPVALAEHMDPLSSIAATTSVLAYRPGPRALPMADLVQGQPTWFDRRGKVLGTVGEPASYPTLSLSPDGTRVAFERLNAERNSDLWLFEFAPGKSIRFTFDPARDFSPVWSPDGSRIAFTQSRNGQADLYVKASNGAGTEDVLLQSRYKKVPTSWSRDGRFLLFYGPSDDPKKPDSLWVLPLGSLKPSLLLNTEFNQRGAQFSPDGRYISYVSNESGRDEIYVRPFDPATLSAAGSQWLVSKGGGGQARWRGDGKELLYESTDGNITSVEIAITPLFHAGEPKPLFKSNGGRNWDVTSDGQKFLIPVPVQTGSASYRVVLNWTSALKQ
jgi:dipeptidyl aminopeptidase/acylaminoacyl peptidase